MAKEKMNLKQSIKTGLESENGFNPEFLRTQSVNAFINLIEYLRAIGAPEQAIDLLSASKHLDKLANDLENGSISKAEAIQFYEIFPNVIKCTLELGGILIAPTDKNINPKMVIL